MIDRLTATVLKASAAITATDTGSAVDISDYTGEALVILNSSATGGADETSNVKLTHCDTEGGSYTDAGVAFTEVTNAAASYQVKRISVDGLKKYVKVVNTLAGTTPAVTFGVEIIGRKAQG